MRHVSEPTEFRLIGYLESTWTHKFQIKYVDTKHQLADILTKGNFTRDEWNNLLHLLTSAISAQFAALKRWRKGCKKRTEKRELCKVKTDVEPGLACCDKVFDCAKSNCIEKSTDIQGTLSTRLEEYRRELWRENLIKTQRRWQKDADLDKSTRRLVAAENDQELLNVRENQRSTRKLVASGNSDIDGIGTIWPHNVHIYTACVSHLQKVLSNVRQRYGIKPGDKMEISM